MKKFVKYPSAIKASTSSMPEGVEKLSLSQAAKNWSINASEIASWFDCSPAEIQYLYTNIYNENDEVVVAQTTEGEYFVAYGGRGSEVIQVNSFRAAMRELAL